MIIFLHSPEALFVFGYISIVETRWVCYGIHNLLLSPRKRSSTGTMQRTRIQIIFIFLLFSAITLYVKKICCFTEKLCHTINISIPFLTLRCFGLDKILKWWPCYLNSFWCYVFIKSVTSVVLWILVFVVEANICDCDSTSTSYFPSTNHQHINSGHFPRK